MANAIFFSWQSDTPNKFGRTFLKEVLEEVCTSIALDTTLDEALRDVEIDSDTQGVAGQPPIAETIFKKIDAAAVFVADMTFTGKRKDGRPLPNPNVLIEYGWALKSLTNERVICIMNDSCGIPSAESLPFDLAHLRWPIRYTLPEEATSETRIKEKQKLVKILKDAISLSLGKIFSRVIDLAPSFPAAEIKEAPARFRASGESLGIQDDFFEEKKEVFLTSGPAVWLRLMPVNNPMKEWSTRELKEVMKKFMPMTLIRGAGGYGYLRSSDGEGIYRSTSREAMQETTISTDSVAFVFKTGEVWSVEVSLLNYKSEWIPAESLEKIFVKGVEMYSKFLSELGVKPPYNWKVGIIGAKGRKLGYTPPPGQMWMDSKTGPICVADLIEAEGQIEAEQPATTALLPFFKKIFDECGRERPDYLPQ